MDLLFWNVDRLSNGDSRARARFDRIMAIATSYTASVIGLSEVNQSGLARLDRFAKDRNFRPVHRKADECRVHAVLLISGIHRVEDAAVWTSAHEGTLSSEAVMAKLEHPEGEALTVAVVYNYSPWPQVLGQVQAFADEHSAGRVVVGGDFNMARSLDDDKRLRHLGSGAFDRIQREFGWTEVYPDPGNVEVPTWPVGRTAPCSPRQLDHVFARGIIGMDSSCSVLVPPEESVRVSDHAMLRARISPSVA